MISTKLISTSILFLCLKTVFCQNCSVEYANNFIINQVDKKYKINIDTTQKKGSNLISQFGTSSTNNTKPPIAEPDNQVELPYSKQLLKDSTKKIETKLLYKALPDWCFFESKFEDKFNYIYKNSLLALNTKHNSLSKIVMANGIVDDDFLDVFKNISVSKYERELLAEDFFKILSKFLWGTLWYRQVITNDDNLYKFIIGSPTHLGEEFFFHFSNNSLINVEVRRNIRKVDNCYYNTTLDTFLTNNFNQSFLEETNINSKECLLTGLLRSKLPNTCFYKTQSKTFVMEFGFVTGIIAINFKNPLESRFYVNPRYNGENKEFWKLFYGIEVRDFEQAEVSKEILDLLSQVFGCEITQIANPKKNIVSFIITEYGVREYDFYFENNKLKKIMRGWGDNKIILE